MTSASTQTAIASGAPMSGAASGARKGRGRSGSVSAQPEHGELRRREGEQHAERVEAREEDDVVRQRRVVAITSAIEITAAATIACGETSVRRFSRPKLARQLPVLAERVREPREA